MCNGQIEVLDFTHIAWHGSSSRNGTIINRIGIDTIRGDTLLIMSELFLRINKKGDTLECLEYNNCLWEKQCPDDKYSFSGSYKEFYNSGKIKRIGNVICNKKAGEWLSFYDSGSIKLYENFETYKLTLGHGFPLQSGVFMKYFPNGKINVSGQYQVVQKFSKYTVIDTITNELKNVCCKWVTTSVKTGVWREYDQEGNIVDQKTYQFDYDSSKIYRKLSDTYIKKEE
jgi:hypothetical protein